MLFPGVHKGQRVHFKGTHMNSHGTVWYLVAIMGTFSTKYFECKVRSLHFDRWGQCTGEAHLHIMGRCQILASGPELQAVGFVHVILGKTF